MKNLLKKLSTKTSLVVVSLIAVLGIGVAVEAWSPDRPTYTIDNPAPHVTFNSITNNPNEGDERAFYEVKDATHTSTGGFRGDAEVHDGQELLLRMYVHNNAASSLNASGKGIARNTKVRIHLPTAQESVMRSNAYISADNAQPKEVSSTIELKGKDGGVFSVQYVPGSARAYTNAVPSGMTLSDSIVTTGAPIGHTKPDGNMPGCFEYDAIVTVKVKVSMPRFSIDKQVSKAGDSNSSWQKSMNVNKNDQQSWMITFKNTGSTELKNVKIVDEVPAGLEVIPGTVKLINGNYPNGYVYPDSAIQANGRQVNVNIGNYNPDGVAYLGFRTKIKLDEKECGTKRIVNKAFATPEGRGAVWETASITVDTGKECEEPEKPSYVCESLTVEKIGGRKVRTTVKAPAAGGAVVKHVVINFGDGSEPKTTTNLVNEHEYQADGTYKITAHVTFTVDGADKTVSSEACEAVVTFKDVPPTTPEVPELPKTGAGSVIGLFTVITSAAAIAHSAFSRRAVR